jgi:hypothetical protein
MSTFKMMGRFRKPAVQAVEFVFIVECAAVGIAYFIGGASSAAAVLIVGPVLLAPMSRQVALKLENRSEQTRPEPVLGRLKLSWATSVFVLGAILGGLSTNVLSHPSVGWRYLAVVASGVLWIMVAAIAMRRNYGDSPIR